MGITDRDVMCDTVEFRKGVAELRTATCLIRVYLGSDTYN